MRLCTIPARPRFADTAPKRQPTFDVDLAHEADMRRLRREQLLAEDFAGDDDFYSVQTHWE